MVVLCGAVALVVVLCEAPRVGTVGLARLVRMGGAAVVVVFSGVRAGGTGIVGVVLGWCSRVGAGVVCRDGGVTLISCRRGGVTATGRVSFTVEAVGSARVARGTLVLDSSGVVMTRAAWLAFVLPVVLTRGPPVTRGGGGWAVAVVSDPRVRGWGLVPGGPRVGGVARSVDLSIGKLGNLRPLFFTSFSAAASAELEPRSSKMIEPERAS